MQFKDLLFLLICSVTFAQNTDFPSAKVDEIVSRIQLPVFPSYQINITKLGAKGDSLTNNKIVFDKAMALCKKNNGGTIIVPKGIYKINGPIHFVSNVNLKIEKGAKIKFSDNPDDYLPMVLTSWEGTMVYNYSPLIYAFECENIAITGEGTIDGEGGMTWKSFKSKENEGKNLSREMNHNNVPLKDRKFGKGYFLRPQMIQFFKCKNILVENIRIEDSPFWCLHLLQSQSITVRGISYKSFNYNNDGIDPEYAKDVLIENVTFDNADDNVAIKAGRDDEGRANSATPSENIVIRNCNFKGLHGVVIGSEMSAGVQNVYVENCKTVGYLKRGIYLKTNADRGGFIKNIFVRKIQLDEVEDCIYITANYHGEGSGHQSEISNVSFSDITCNKVSAAGIVIQGFPDKKIKNISLNNIEIKWAKNAISSENAENVLMNEVVIGERATIPSAAK
ncbi:glycoside hydrolase family 28 protein [Flavobacterium sp. Fl-77]|uniref:Glycoside hydrolase family 28 protein n=1 Tax=Flavobacterium flavipigmentatum TaxID=2893884 RepID=A0AAJ2VXS1_9FLAO|nr:MULTISPECIES: glycoside hydrolase family 28 protein [unclassified Flavobacterium]MDX6183630.1 glycoside hydrolase family 28 protein [Flavobacterium sp. Fl-33]MDX6187182.1 glycoside hydrolase family 28 protein [Flavobacterium sp. Fl-77]UFH38007.1 glycoside hydrolase family 28 protein [Flavobacterium sp. F-70]